MARWNARLARGVLAVWTALVLAPWSLAAAPQIRFATAYAADNFQTRNLQRFADDLRTATQGKVDIKVHAGGTLIQPAGIFAGVRKGEAEGGEVILSSLARENPLFGIDALPFIVSGYEDAWRMWEASRPAIDRLLAERGLRLLYAVPWPPQNLYSRTPVTTIQDFRGLRMRAYNPATERIAELLRAKPVTIQVIELGKAIADGKLDLMLTSSWTGVETRAWTTLPHYYKVSAWIPKNIVFIRRDVFERLDDAARTTLVAQAREAEERGWRMSRDSDLEFERQLAANKVQIAPLDFFLRQHLDRVGEALAREWLKQAGNEELNILLRYTTERSMLQGAAKQKSPGLALGKTPANLPAEQ